MRQLGLGVDSEPHGLLAVAADDLQRELNVHPRTPVFEDVTPALPDQVHAQCRRPGRAFGLEQVPEKVDIDGFRFRVLREAIDDPFGGDVLGDDAHRGVVILRIGPAAKAQTCHFSRLTRSRRGPRHRGPVFWCEPRAHVRGPERPAPRRSRVVRA